MSQTVFACLLNITPGYLSQLERGAKRPTGPALALLHVIRRKGIEAVVRRRPDALRSCSSPRFSGRTRRI